VIALSRLYALSDPRLKAIIVQGDMIVDPSQYTQIPIPLKIIKLLIKELVPVPDSSAIQQGINASASQVGDSDDEWEDLDDVGFPGSKKDLMALGDEGSGRQSRIRDDETNVFLIEFFKNIYNGNVGNFREMVSLLNEEERHQLSLLGGQS